jgi:hypothetical protein
METPYVLFIMGTFILMFFLIGGIIGWLFNRHVIETTPPYIHPEFFDKNGNVIADEVLAVTFENPEDFEYDEDDD